MNTVFKIFFRYFFLLIISIGYISVDASVTNGTISSTYNSALLCINDTCTNTTRINFKTTEGNPIQITDSSITGNAWSETFGWINFNPTLGGVNNTSGGVLSGYAWGDSSGWINFNPTLGGVTINNSGQFVGYAWSENYGWIKFDCSISNACVSTDWRPLSARSSGGGGSRTIGYLPPVVVEAPVVPVTTSPIVVSIVKKPVVEKAGEMSSPIKEDEFVNPQPVTPPGSKSSADVSDSKPLVSSLDSISDSVNNEKKESLLNGLNNTLMKTIGLVQSNIFSDYFLGISFYYKIFSYQGYINPFWIGLIFIFIVYIIIYLIIRNRKKKKAIMEGGNVNI